jgi:hypothetical protein
MKTSFNVTSPFYISMNHEMDEEIGYAICDDMEENG